MVSADGIRGQEWDGLDDVFLGTSQHYHERTQFAMQSNGDILKTGRLSITRCRPEFRVSLEGVTP